MAADVGGIPEAKMGVPYLLPVNPIRHYAARLDEQMVPVAEVPEQNIGPWREALHRLLADRLHYKEIARASRAAALEHAAGLSVEPFEELLRSTPLRPRPACEPIERKPADTISPERRRLLAIRLRKRAPASAWFPGAEAAAGPRLFWFPHAGGGTVSAGVLRRFTICPVRLPGRESRLAEAPFETMRALVAALADIIQPFLPQPFAFFGHSMGAAVAFELARELRRRGGPQPAALIASAARAPQFRRNHVPPPPPTEDQLLAELRRLEGIPADVLDDPGLMRAILPALAADAALYRNYVYAEDAPLACPIRAYGGCDDPNVHREHLEAWAAQTTASFAIRLFPGGHFYLHACRAEVLAGLDEDLS
jgi:surfactin synthase thioesterase subunit